MSLHAILSIHDVAPHTLQRVKAIIDILPARAHNNLILLIIPGLDWNDEQLETLRKWQEKGYTLAGHGWYHKAKQIHSVYHRIHSFFISRDVAEHLSLSEEEVQSLMQKNRLWFTKHKFNEPDCYVPPAWALGKITSAVLKQTGYRYIETTGGYIDTKTSRNIRLPLIGFEADTQLRKLTLIIWNWINAKFSSKKKPLRISIHPYDNEYLLSDSMQDWLKAVDQYHCYSSLFKENSA